MNKKIIGFINKNALVISIIAIFVAIIVVILVLFALKIGPFKKGLNHGSGAHTRKLSIGKYEDKMHTRKPSIDKYGGESYCSDLFKKSLKEIKPLDGNLNNKSVYLLGNSGYMYYGGYVDNKNIIDLLMQENEDLFVEDKITILPSYKMISNDGISPSLKDDTNYSYSTGINKYSLVDDIYKAIDQPLTSEEESRMKTKYSGMGGIEIGLEIPNKERELYWKKIRKSNDNDVIGQRNIIISDDLNNIIVTVDYSFDGKSGRLIKDYPIVDKKIDKDYNIIFYIEYVSSRSSNIPVFSVASANFDLACKDFM